MNQLETKPCKIKQPQKSKADLLVDIFSLDADAWRWAGITLLLAVLAVWFGVIFSIPPASLQGWLVTAGFALVAAVLSLLLGNLIIALLNLFQKVPERCRWLITGSLFLLFNLLMPLFQQVLNVLFIIGYVMFFAFLLGVGIAGLRSKTAANPAQTKRGYAAVLLGGIGLLVAVIWIVWPGPSYDTASYLQSTPIPPLTLEDPSQQGLYSVLTMTYGSGSDKRRPEYAAGAEIITNQVDISSMVKGDGGVTGWLRQLYWGFDLSAVPLNGRVWYPDGQGPFPLVLVVHGNHSMDSFSDPGYDYLGELLASRGFIVASVDQNFLNGSGMLEAVLGGLKEENDARAYLLLQHLTLWQEWNHTEQHPFAGKVDMERIALIGHSRGGEAAAIAAAFNHLPAHPDNALIPFNFGFSIRAVAAIAPSDGQYRPRQQNTPLEDINYLVLQGSADSDVSSFSGSRQFDRVRFTDTANNFKAAVYIHGANHGQFNSRWGRIDMPASLWFLNRGQIMPADKQKTAATVFISGFLEAALHDRPEYADLFQNPASARRWLPATVYVAQYQSSNTLLLAGFEEDINPQSATLPGGRLRGENLTVWREEPVTLGTGTLRDAVSVRLGWDLEGKGPAFYSLDLPPGLHLEESDRLLFDLANAGSGQTHLDLSLKLVDESGREATLTLSYLASLPQPLAYRNFKPPLRVSFASEPVFTTYSFTLNDFLAANNSLDIGSLKEIRFIFDRSPAGEIYLDNLGILSES